VSRTGFRAKYVVTALSLCLAVALAGVLVERSGHDRAAAVGHAKSALAATVDQLAVNLAAGDRDSDPSTVTWVLTTVSAADQYVNGVTNPTNNASTSAIALVVQGGRFVATGEHVKPGNPEASGTLLFAVVVQSNMDVVAQGVGVAINGSSDPTLTELGTPETDSLSGISPSHKG